MIFQIDGTNTINKGAELMLYAILEQIEAKYPNSKVNFNSYSKKPTEITTSLNLYKRPSLSFGNYPKKILVKLGMNIARLSTSYPIKEIDIVFDASGFRFGDQWEWKHTTEYLNTYESYLKKLKQAGVKVYYLPQAFGPFNTDSGKRSAEILNKYSNYIFAREKTSYDYLKTVGINEDKVAIYTDFTNLVKCNSNEYPELRERVCIIPNKKMLTKTRIESTDYLEFYNKLINQIYEFGLKVFLLNHEGEGDLTICNKIVERVNSNIPIITGKGPKTIKSLIGNSYAVISSRFHGVASALSQEIPCVATSWSHKYELLFNDYELSGYILNVNNDIDNKEKIELILDKSNNIKISNHLSKRCEVLEAETNEMWKQVWGMIDS